MKLYTYTMDYSLPRLALKGFPADEHLSSLVNASDEAVQENTKKAKAVVLQIDSEGLEIMVSSRGTDSAATAAAEGFSYGREDLSDEEAEALGEKAFQDVYDQVESAVAAGDTEGLINLIGYVKNRYVIPPGLITVLGSPTLHEPDYDAITAAAEAAGKEPEYPEAIVTFDAAPKPLKSFKQPFVSRLLRSIFLPQHKLYGGGKRHSSPAMGFMSRFLPKREEGGMADEPPPDTVSGVPLVWAAGKTFRRGMRGAFGDEVGDAVAQLVAMRAGQEPGKYLGKGAKGAVYALGQGRVLKVTMDGSEVQAAAHLIGVRHPNLSLVHDVFVVTNGVNGAGIIVRDAVDTTLDRFNKEAAAQVDRIMDEVLASVEGKADPDGKGLLDLHPSILIEEVGRMIALFREEGCDVEESFFFDLADAFRTLKHYGIIGIDFDSKNVGIVKKPKPRVVIFDYGMTKSPPVEVEVVSLQSLRA